MNAKYRVAIAARAGAPANTTTSCKRYLVRLLLFPKSLADQSYENGDKAHFLRFIGRRSPNHSALSDFAHRTNPLYRTSLTEPLRFIGLRSPNYSASLQIVHVFPLKFHRIRFLSHLCLTLRASSVGFLAEIFSANNRPLI